MTLEGLVLRSLRHRRLAAILSVLSVALGVGLVVGIDALRREARTHFERSVSWDLVVGPPKGSPLQLVLCSLFHVDEAPGTLPVSVYESLRDDPRVALALPQVLGDSWRGHRVVGTGVEFFGSEARRGVAVACAAGAPFAPFDPARPCFEAVLGATVAARESLKIGDTFVATHSLEEIPGAEEHDEAPWKVVGVLAPTGTPVDRVIWIHWRSFYAMQGHDAAAGRGPGAEPRLSAVLVRAADGASANLLFHQWRASDDAQPVRPFEQVAHLFDLVGRVDRLLVAVSALVVLVAAVGILVAMTSGMRERRRDLALMRALGAPRRVLAGLMVGEAATLGLFGGIAGLALGHGIVALGASAVGDWCGVRIRPFAFSPQEVIVLAGAVLLCMLAGLLPAAMAYRSDVAEGLAPEG